jgi:hypothetical protein
MFRQPGEDLSGRRTRLLPGWCGVSRGIQPRGGIWNGKTQTIKKRTFHNLEITSLSLSGNKITTIEEEAQNAHPGQKASERTKSAKFCWLATAGQLQSCQKRAFETPKECF